MSYKFVVFPTPLDAVVTLSSDDGWTGTGIPYVDENGRQGQLITVASGVTNEHGATLSAMAQDRMDFRLRGFLLVGVGENKDMARLQVDDFTMNEVPPPVVQPGPPVQPPPIIAGGGSPEEICQQVYNTTHPNLMTKEGCGKYTEDCCDALHSQHSPSWGHIRKNAGQNQYNGHAVDALMLIVDVPGTASGIYDLIYSTESPDAKPTFNYVGQAVSSLWYYPAVGAYNEGFSR